MTWEEAMRAFRAQVPVTLRQPGMTPIRCIRIAEIGLRCDEKGNQYGYIGALDMNRNTLYHARPAKFEVTR